MLKHAQNISPAQNEVRKIMSMCFSPNGQKFAFVAQDNILHLFDDKMVKKDKITLRGAVKENTNFVAKGLAFSPDGSIIAVA